MPAMMIPANLCHAGTVTPDGVSRATLAIGAGRINASSAAGGYRIDLRT
jgi:hypothetical protein